MDTPLMDALKLMIFAAYIKEAPSHAFKRAFAVKTMEYFEKCEEDGFTLQQINDMLEVGYDAKVL